MSRILPEALVARIRYAFDYEQETGILRWKYATHGYGGKIQRGDEAGTSKDGYKVIGFMGDYWPAHHIAWIIMTGDLFPPGKEIDHRNRIRSDNHWLNLRLVDRTGNNFNSLPHSNNKSGMKGVSWDARRQRWHARITVNGEITCLGDYANFDDACAARRTAELRYVGEYAAVYEVPTTSYNERTGVEADKVKHLRETWANPELRAEHSKKIAAACARPEVKTRKSIASTISNARPEVRAKNAASVSNLIWITNGTKSARIPKDQPIPEGWIRGKGMWITNGAESRTIPPNQTIPEGWSRGRTI